MNLHVSKLRAQSAMEYLMTYGWAILIIAVVLGALFSLGVFNSSSLIGTACIPLSGYYCANPVLSTNGILTVTIGQATGTTYSSVTAYFVPSGSTFTNSYPSTQTGFSLNSGQTTTATFNLASLPSIGSAPSLGTALTGQIWLAYSTASAPGTTLDTQIATVTVKVT